MALSDDTINRLKYGLASNAAGQEVADAIGSDQALASGQIIVGSSGGVATDVAMSGDVTIGNTGVTAIGAGKVTNAMVAPNTLDGTVVKSVAAANVIGGIPLLFVFTLSAGALAANAIVTTHKIRVLDAYLILQGAGVANTTITIQSGSTAISNAMAASGSDQALVRATTMDDAAWEIAAGGSLTAESKTGATQPACTVYVRAMRVA